MMEIVIPKIVPIIIAIAWIIITVILFMKYPFVLQKEDPLTYMDVLVYGFEIIGIIIVFVLLLFGVVWLIAYIVPYVPLVRFV